MPRHVQHTTARIRGWKTPLFNTAGATVGNVAGLARLPPILTKSNLSLCLQNYSSAHAVKPVTGQFGVFDFEGKVPKALWFLTVNDLASYYVYARTR